MNNLPLITFWQENKYLVSNNYSLHSYNGDDWSEWLEEFDKKYHNQIKVIKVNYPSSYNQKTLYQDNFIDVFVLNDYEVLSKSKSNSTNNDFKISSFKNLIEKSQYLERFKSVIENIKNGEFYQLNYTLPFQAEFAGNPLHIFNHYESRFKGNYHAFLPLEHGSLISMSPELFLQKTNNKLITQPIKGTSKNSETEIKKLLESPKENAELSMIVDLLRNDLNRVANKHDKVNFHRKIMTLGNLAHTYSEIEVETKKNLPEILRNCFPGGSISGCPKKAACEFIAEIEPFKRGFYTGTMGWWHKKDFSLNILIRSFFATNTGEIFYHAGGGVVYDSNPQAEFDELMLKAEMI